ncbi:hypothetical protein CK203_088955 [Vitis vinifera]|uniref:Small-subunit processome Utp12 domain-containing protein n=1 Tax=Vitis vinifera TaxID=29760 RepID=A0A438DX84_VITVI|nr:hypothetical protein CK203_088955 [Vitis vinifera]
MWVLPYLVRDTLLGWHGINMGKKRSKMRTGNILYLLFFLFLLFGASCMPLGVSAISCSTDGSCIYAAGADGMISKIDSSAGNLLGKFRASTKAISSMSVSSDGKVLATAAAQLKILNSSDHKKIQKFSGHPGAVRCMIFTDDGEYILSSAIDSRCIDNGDTDKSGLYVLAISEIGVCYFWYAKNMEDLRNTKPTKVSVSLEDNFSKNHKGSLPTIFAANYKVLSNLHQDGILLPMDQSHKSKKGLGVKDGVTALDRANAEEALLPIPKIFDFHEKNKRYQNSNIDPDEIMADDLMNVRSQNKAVESKGSYPSGILLLPGPIFFVMLVHADDLESVEASNETSCLEEQLRSLGLLDNKDDLTSNSMLNSTKFKGISLEENMPPKKMRAAVSSIIPGDAYELLKVLVTMWQSRSCSGSYVLPWIYTILVNHSQHIVSQEPVIQLLDSLHQSTKSRGTAVQSLLQLSGGLQLVMAQIDKASQNISQIQHGHQVDESEDEEEEVEDVLCGEEDDESQISSDNDD